MKLLKTINVGNQLGEGVIWDHRRQRLWWVDIEGQELFRYDPATEQLERWQTPERLACLAPVAGRDDLIVAFATGFAFYQPDTDRIEWIEKIERDNPGTRMNDGRTDRQGRFWAGSMIEDPENASYKGSLYCVGHDLAISKHIQELSITNSLCWSPDGETMYHCDTPARTIQAYEFVSSSGHANNANTILKTESGCYPDGSCVDAQGFIWNAQWGGSKVVRYTPEGVVDLELSIPTAQPSCVSFGGPNLDLLFVTSAKQDMTEAQLNADPKAGSLFVYQTDFRGLEDTEFEHRS